MRFEELKIKIRSLAAEQTMIHRREIKLKKRARRQRVHPSTRLDATVASFWSLRGHRVELRDESRAALLAYAFLRGIPYAKLELVSRTDPPLRRVERIARKFGEADFSEAAWDGWERAAIEHQEAGLKVLRQREAAKRQRTEEKRNDTKLIANVGG